MRGLETLQQRGEDVVNEKGGTGYGGTIGHAVKVGLTVKIVWQTVDGLSVVDVV